jgi:glutamate N-acetyltransferase/amino-acid N-acetyltransferase
MADVQWIDGGITAVPGILAAGITAGIKPSGKKDIALIYSSAPARAAAIFTTNQVKGASVLVSQGARPGRQGAGHRRLERVLQCVHG